MESMIDDPDVGDVVFLVGGRQIHANSGILRKRCEFFGRMLSGHFKEGAASSFSSSNKRRRTNSGAAAAADSSSAAVPTVPIPDADPDAFLEVLRFLHSSRCMLTPATCVPILELANRFGLPELTSLVGVQMGTLVDVANVCSLLEAADRLGPPAHRER